MGSLLSTNRTVVPVNGGEEKHAEEALSFSSGLDLITCGVGFCSLPRKVENIPKENNVGNKLTEASFAPVVATFDLSLSPTIPKDQSEHIPEPEVDAVPIKTEKVEDAHVIDSVEGDTTFRTRVKAILASSSLDVESLEEGSVLQRIKSFFQGSSNSTEKTRKQLVVEMSFEDSLVSPNIGRSKRYSASVNKTVEIDVSAPEDPSLALKTPPKAKNQTEPDTPQPMDQQKNVKFAAKLPIVTKFSTGNIFDEPHNSTIIMLAKFLVEKYKLRWLHAQTLANSTAGFNWPSLLRFSIWRRIEGVAQDVKRDEGKEDARVCSRISSLKGRLLNPSSGKKSRGFAFLSRNSPAHSLLASYDLVFICKADNPTSPHLEASAAFILLLTKDPKDPSSVNFELVQEDAVV